MTKCKYIDDYIADIRSGKIKASKEMHQACDYIEGKLSAPDVFIDNNKIEKAIEIIERYLDIQLLPWELFIVSLIHCYYTSDDTVVFREFFIMMGRGNGKNGFISGIAFYLTTHYHGIKGYNVDIIANSEDQAKVSFDDVYTALENFKAKLKKFFYWSKEEVRNLRTNSYIRFNTSNARTKDGKRSACLIFDEEHEYENAKSIGVFSSGFGKRKHSRIFKITTNGTIRGGVLDDDIRLAQDVLEGRITNLKLCPLIYKMNSDKDCLNPDLWEMANPSINYFTTLRQEIEVDFIEKDYKRQTEIDFYTKRMNRPRTNMDVHVTEWENIEAAGEPLIDLTGKTCICGIDFANIRDWAAVNLRFIVGDKKYDINHAWICTRSPELSRIQAPWQDWVEDGYLTAVDDVEIGPQLITDYILEQMEKYQILRVQMDNYRHALMKRFLADIGFDAKEKKNVYIIKKSDIAMVVPIIESDFAKRRHVWGPNRMLMWATNNASVVTPGKNTGESSGNRYYGKIELKSRKTDPFMAMVASAVNDDDLRQPDGIYLDNVDFVTW